MLLKELKIMIDTLMKINPEMEVVMEMNYDKCNHVCDINNIDIYNTEKLYLRNKKEE